MTSCVIVFDTIVTQFLGNRIFNKNLEAQFRGGALFISHLQNIAVQNGLQIITADIFLETKPKFSQAVCISDRFTPRTQLLLDRGVIPAVIMTEESPNVDWWFYHNLTKHSGIFKHAFFFRGAGERVKPTTQFHSFLWPNDRIPVSPSPEWIDRAYLVMVSGNKSRFWVSPNRPFIRTRRFAKRLLWDYLQKVDSWFELKDLYEDRLDAICYFADRPGFRLFGRGWEQLSGLSKRHTMAIQKVGVEPVDDKLMAMSGFKFALCFENCVFPGYITEKIFDCFYAGCIPIYFGAPDITDFVPSETFIDFRSFQDISDLDEYLCGLSERQAYHYLEAARDFLSGPEFKKFHYETFAKELFDIIKQEITSAS